MLKRLKQLKKLWDLTGKDHKFVAKLTALDAKEIVKMPSVGNGKAVFMPDMDQAALDKYNHEHRSGWKKFNDMVRNLTP